VAKVGTSNPDRTISLQAAVRTCINKQTLTVDGGEWSTSLHGRFNPGNEPRYRLNKRLSGPQSLSGRFGQQKSFVPKITSRIEFPTFVQYRIIPSSVC
jgi:hypothetical protein